MARLRRSVGSAVLHPAGLLSAGNTALAIGQAEPLGILLNIGLTATIFSARFLEVMTTRALGVPFLILALVNFLTAISVEFNKALGETGSAVFAQGLKTFDAGGLAQALTLFDASRWFSLDQAVIAGHVSALAFVVWGIGHLWAGRHEKRKTKAKHIRENPQTYYGVGDMAAVNASGSLNPFSFPFLLLGFVKSILIGHRFRKKGNDLEKFVQKDVTAARLYGLGFVVGALTSLGTLNFAIAQACWALAYFQFKKDT